MIKKILLISLVLLVSFINVRANEDQEEVSEETSEEVVSDPLNLDAEAAILMDAKTGMVLYKKNIDKRMYPASLTKILTVYLASANLNPNTLITASTEAIFGFDRNSSHIWLTPDEEVKALDLEYAALLASANDASNMLAEGVSKNIDDFVVLMNTTISEMGLTNTHFTNVHGLYDENHYTTAYDMALITRMTLKSLDFKTIFTSKTYEMNPTNKQENKRTFASGNKMIKSSEFYYEYASGGKIGWTPESGYNMVTTASKDNMDLIAVVLNCSDSDKRYLDTKALFEYGFSRYKTLILKGKDLEVKVEEIKKGGKLEARVTFSLDKDLNILLPIETDETSVTTEVEVRNKDDKDKINAYLLVRVNNEVVGEVIMDKNLEEFDISFKATTLPLISRGLDFFSIFVLSLFMAVSFVKLTRKVKLPE